jgi:hypothetical protein
MNETTPSIKATEKGMQRDGKMRRGERRRRVTPCLEKNELAFTYLLA